MICVSWMWAWLSLAPLYLRVALILFVEFAACLGGATAVFQLIAERRNAASSWIQGKTWVPLRGQT